MLEDGSTFEYDSCLIATGGSPKTPPCLSGLPENTMIYRTVWRTLLITSSNWLQIGDFQRLKEICTKVKSVCVIGGNLLASELALSIADLGIKVIQLFSGAGMPQFD